MPTHITSPLVGFSVPKIGYPQDMNDDAWKADGDVASGYRVAISDGATQALYAGRWAQTLVSRFITQTPKGAIAQQWLDPAALDLRATYDIAQLPWYVQKRAIQGSFATLLGLGLDLESETYRAVSVGDSCLAIITETSRPTRTRLSFFPSFMGMTSAFTDSPYLVASNPQFNSRLKENQMTRRRCAFIRGRTTFVLMTDALAEWFVKADDARERPWDRFTELITDGAFADFVSDLRHHRAIRDDDTTLVMITVQRD